MWRNTCINDTYEPGSTFKIITAAAGLEEGVVKLTDPFSCPGFRVVEDRRIRCHKAGGHGAETFLQGVMNSCNPVFIDVGQRLGSDNYYKYFVQFGLKQKTGIDLPGEAATIMHKKENIGPVELATISFGQSFQITPIQLITTAASIVNGGRRITPHFALGTVSLMGKITGNFLAIGKKDPVRRDQCYHALCVRAGSSRRKWEKGSSGRIFHWREDRNFRKTAKKQEKIYFFFFRFCPCK